MLAGTIHATTGADRQVVTIARRRRTHATSLSLSLSLSFSLSLCLCALIANPAAAQVIIPGADGSDGAFSRTSNITVNLDQAPNGVWNGANPNPGQGKGVYDPDKWAIVFRYSSVNIPSNVTVRFYNHPANPPVVWLVSGAVTITGVVNLRPGAFDALNMGVPGPGGFRGGGTGANYPMGGMGPGGGLNYYGQADFAGGPNAYGNSRCLPLIGGSGGGSLFGGAGGILIACPGTLTLHGGVDAYSNDQNGNNTGGAVRLICDRLQGTGYVYAYNSQRSEGNGRVRFEANQVAFGSLGVPTASFGLPGATAQIWPDDAVAPKVKVLSLGAAAVPIEPQARFDFPYADVNLTSGIAQTITIQANNVPTGTDPAGTPAWNVVARVVPRGSNSFTVNATFVSGNYAQSTWTATATLPNGFCAIQARASMPPQ